MDTKYFIGVAFSFISLFSHGQKWLPHANERGTGYRLLHCVYQDALLEERENITSESSKWEVRIDSVNLSSTGANACKYTFKFKAKRDMHKVGVAVAFDNHTWTSDNYVMLPASVYNGNRQRIVNRDYATGLDKTDYYRKDLALTSNPIPQLSPEFGAKSLLEVNVSNVATPAITYFERSKQKGVLLLTEQGLTWGDKIIDHGLIVEESADRSTSSFVITAPGVRERKPEFIGFSKSYDRGIDVKQGDEVVITVTRIAFQCASVPQLLERFNKERKTHTGLNNPRNLMPESKILTLMAKNIDDRYYKNDKWEYYCPENADWISFGWIGGLMNTYPMLVLGDNEHLRRVKNTFDFALSKGQCKSGYFMDVLGSDGYIVKRDAAKENPEIGLTRKNADILYWMVKQFMLLKRQGKASEISKEWETSIKKLADAFVITWQKNKTWGNYLNIETGDIAVYNTSSGALAVGGLALASEYFNEPLYLKIAMEAANNYYEEYSLIGFTSGGCGDILQNSDSETAAALMLSFMTLYENTNQPEWLLKSKSLADLCATWTVSFDYVLPSETPLAKLGAKLAGAVWASTQNKHGAPGFCTASGDPLFKIFRATGDRIYANLMKDIMHAHTEGIQPNGRITERLTYCDADSRGSRGDGGKTGWNELNGALMAIEIPGIYVRKDLGEMYVFDQVEAKIAKNTSKEMVLTIHNPTAHDAQVSLLLENKKEASMPLGCNAFMDWQKINIKAGKTIYRKIKK